MAEPTFFSPSDSPDPSKVRRSKDGRPYVKSPCPDADQHVPDVLKTGARVLSEKRPGNTVQCPTCKGKGYIEKLYARCTSFVGVLDDRSNLERWKLRTVLTGLGVDHNLLAQLDRADPDDREQLDRLADEAFEIGDGHMKAQKGTDLHELSTYVDAGLPLPESLVDYETGQERPVTLQDRADLAAWKRTVDDLGIVMLDTERFVVQDHYKIGGTYDRLVTMKRQGQKVHKDHLCAYCDLPVILDLKTGRIDYGAGKIAQQLAVYAHSDDYDPATGERSKQDVCPHIGIVIHLPQGTGEATVMLADLEAGWQAVDLSSQVREHRRISKDWLQPLVSDSDLSRIDSEGQGVESPDQ